MKNENFKMEPEVDFRQLVKDEVDKYLKEVGFPVKKEDKQNNDIYIIQRPCIDNASNSIVRQIYVNKYFHSKEEAKKYIRTIPNHEFKIFNISKLSEYTEEKVGFEDDEIFLLSTEEHEKYKDIIPKIHCCWWLRSPGYDFYNSAVVGSADSASIHGNFVKYGGNGIRPAFKIPDINISNLKVGDRFIRYDFPWIVIDENLAIAEVPIAFDKFDDKSNDYENSYIRKFLKEWVDKRR